MIPHIAAPPPTNDTPARAANSAGADSDYYRVGEQNDKRDTKQAQAWRACTPAHLIASVDRHRLQRPDFPLPSTIQRRIGQAWVQS
jgi:hypothetical protein